MPEQTPPQEERQYTAARAPQHRAAGSAINIDWGSVSAMEPSQAMNYLQQVANSQGIVNPMNQKEDGRLSLFRDLISQYAVMNDIDDKVNERYWNDLLKPHQIEALKLAVKEEAARSKYFPQLAELEFNITGAKHRKLLKDILMTEKHLEGMDSAMMDPSQALKMWDTADRIIDRNVTTLRRSAELHYKNAKEEGSKEAWNAYLQRQLLHDFASGAVDIGTPYEKIPLRESPGWFRGKSNLTEEQVEAVRAQAQSTLLKFNQLNSYVGAPGAGGGSEFMQALASLGIDLQ